MLTYNDQIKNLLERIGFKLDLIKCSLDEAEFGITVLSPPVDDPGENNPQVLVNLTTRTMYYWDGDSWEGVYVILPATGVPVDSPLGDFDWFRIYNGVLYMWDGVDTWIDIADANFVRSGVYNPTIQDTVNLTGTPTASTAQWMRVGNVITVSGRITGIDPTATGGTLTTFTLSLPIGGSFSNAGQLGGVAFNGESSTVSSNYGASIYADTSGGYAKFSWAAINSSSVNFSYTFTYKL